MTQPGLRDMACWEFLPFLQLSAGFSESVISYLLIKTPSSNNFRFGESGKPYREDVMPVHQFAGSAGLTALPIFFCRMSAWGGHPSGFSTRIGSKPWFRGCEYTLEPVSQLTIYATPQFRTIYQ